ncbi:MAG: CPBP family intramembrane metalloprotease [Clostridia bacterium]|nr:CPBP family intramembrane metalloprotease [Clostridia bacterium]
MEQKSPIHPPWGIIEALLVLVLVNLTAFMFRKFGSGFLLNIVELFPGGPTQLNQLLLSSIIQTGLFLSLILFIVKLVHGQDLKALGLVRNRLGYWLKIGLLNGIVLFISVVFLGALINYLVPIEVDPQPITEIILKAETSWEIFIPFLVTAIFAPISEELYFRGLLYPALRRRIGVKWGIIVTSLIFGGLHYDLVRMIPLVFGGIWLNWLYEKSGTIYAPMMAHSAWNGIMCFLILYPLPTTL